ncbi:MAG: two-component system response regulator CreB [Methylobacillus sp.]|jgi:two-component system catabolic regulation response regulator CreB|nr:two-component system response regulator CreB [Methylobacillus sp.]
MPTSILIIEDEPAIADTLIYTLKSEGYLPQHCTLGSQGLEALRSGQYALAILDIGLPDMSGFDVCREARTFTDIPIIFLTARAGEIDHIVGLELGADDYVTKPFSPREVVARVRTRLRRTAAAPTSPTAASAPASETLFEVDAESGRIRFHGTLLDLTRYEYLLLKTLLERPGRIYSRDELMDRVWSDALDTSDRTVDTHIKTLRYKLKVINEDKDRIITHRGMGYSIDTGKPS